MTLVLLHSWGSSGREWDLVRSALVSPTIAPDLPGFGACPGPEWTRVSELSDWIGSLVEGLDRYVIVGHSMAGKAAMALAARRPSGLAGLVLVAPSPLGPEPMSEDDRAKSLSDFGDRTAAEATVAQIARLPLSEPSRNHAIEDYLRSRPWAWRNWMEAGSIEDLTFLAAEIEVPTLVVAGGADPILEFSMLRREVADRIAGARFETISGCGHLVPREAPERLAQLITGFVSESASI